MTLEIKIDKNNINVANFEDIFYKTNLALFNLSRINRRERKIHINILEANFIDPYSITNFCILLRYLQRYSTKIYLSLPRDTNINNYLKRMDFFHSIPQRIELLDKPSPNLYRKHPIRESDVLLELTPIQTQKDIQKVIEYAIEKIGRILKKSLGYNDNDISAFCTALAETCQNIRDHSGDKGLVAVQKYHSHTNYVIIGVCDLGIGIKKSLSCRYNVSLWNHREVIRNALQLGTSRYIDRGKGLYRVTEIVKKYCGTLIIRSGSGRVEIGKRNSSITVPYFPGTQIYILLQERTYPNATK